MVRYRVVTAEVLEQDPHPVRPRLVGPGREGRGAYTRAALALIHHPRLVPSFSTLPFRSNRLALGMPSDLDKFVPVVCEAIPAPLSP